MKKVFLIRWFSDDNVWKAFSSPKAANDFVKYVNHHNPDDLKVYVDSVILE